MYKIFIDGGIKIRGNTRSKWSRTTIFSDDSLLSKAAPSARNVNIQFLRRAVHTRPLGRPFILYRTRFSIQYTDTFQFIHMTHTTEILASC